MSKHGVLKKIVSDRGSVFTSAFWQQLQQALGTQLDFSTAHHPQTGGQTERTNQILEDMLRACVFDFGGSWDEHLALAEFAIRAVFEWHCLKRCMEGSANHRYVDMKPKKRNF